MGKACTRALDRVAAATGKIDQAETRFEELQDVKGGGVLCALPALLANGLFKHIDRYFSLPKGYYGIVHVFLLLAFMALARVKNIERLRYEEPGEWGKLLGLDRIPEVRTLRDKVSLLCEEEGQVSQWSGHLSNDWMSDNPLETGVLYIDGHVRVYYGSKSKLPRRYVSRQKLALRGVTDYWVNDQLGRPFFTVSSAFTTGLIDVLETDIIPRLIEDIPGQPNQFELERDPYRSRFVLIFDREGYSPDFFSRLWKQRIACQTYQKYPGENWPESEFQSYRVRMPQGEIVEMKLAERGLFAGNRIWVREIRRKCKNGHQTSVISTDYHADLKAVAVHMFSRWTQENFFKYMMENFDIDALTGYHLLDFNETRQVVNPQYRQLEGQIKSKAAILARRKAKFHDVQLTGSDLSQKQMESYVQRKGELKEEIEHLQSELNSLKQQRKQTRKHIAYEELPEEERFYRIAPVRKQLLDTIKMISYRAETAMAQILKEHLGRKDDTRPLLKQLYKSDIDIVPDEKNKILGIKLHHLTRHQADQAISELCDHLNQTETTYPGTDFKIKYELVSN